MTSFEPARMARAPRGFPADHPAIDLILRRQWGVSARLPSSMALSPALSAEILKRFRAAAPLVFLLNEPLVPVLKMPLP